MILLALDTCDSRGSVAVLRGPEVLQVVRHENAEDYSSWLLPNVEKALASCALQLQDVEVFAAAAGPGSFTALRVGLTSVKAWSEVYGRKIASISRLEAIASQADGDEGFVAAFVDAQRGQVFGGLFQREGSGLVAVGDELVIPPEGFVNWVRERSGKERVAWVSMDPDKITTLDVWKQGAKTGETVQTSLHVLAPLIGKIGLQRAQQGQLIDALSLDAQYVRRSDAEIFWKGLANR